MCVCARACVLQEQSALLEKGFKEKADMMNQQILRLRGEMNNEDQSKRSVLSKVVSSVGTAASLFLPGIIPKAAGFAASYLSRFF